ncbi:MAG TPA: diguanylate cyclase [Candidatus Eisenbacteria bacterium]|nr:diguanylate cyclase [Candidatus Eisenbacteria bacterium]
MTRKKSHFLRQALPAAAVLLLSVSAALYLWKAARENADRQVHFRFEAQTKEIAFFVQKRLELYGNALYSLKALFTVSDVGPSEWSTFTETESLRERYPGLTALRFIQRVPASERDAFEKATGIGIRSSRDRDEYFPVLFVYPAAGNELMPGFDVASERPLSEALQLARDTGRPAAAEPLPGPAGSRTFVIFAPVYRRGTAPADVSARRESLAGFLDLVLKIDDLLANSYNPSAARDIRFEIFDGEESESTRLYDSRPGAVSAGPLTQTIPMEVAGRVWLLHFSALPEFSDTPETRLPRVYLFGGLALSLLLSGIVLALSTSRSRAVSFAEKMTVDLSREIGERKLADEKLQRLVQDLERRNHEASLMGELGELLQSCSRLEEAYPLIGRFAPLFFPDTRGALYLINGARNLVEGVADWGIPLAGERIFVQDDCWALKRGKPHFVHAGGAEPACKHVVSYPPEGYLCVPMMAQGQGLGVLHLQGASGTAPREELAVALAGESALALANLKLREALHAQSIRDRVTGLYNRHYLQESLDRELLRTARRKESLGLLMIDIDHFKHFNDAYGHEVGDAILAAVGKFLASRFRGDDLPCRYGGEEFVVILPGASLESSAELAGQVREEIKTIKVNTGSKMEGITLSIGVAAYPALATTPEALLRSADQALYRAKDEGRDRVLVGVPVPG